jgi:hypothetical protein
MDKFNIDKYIEMRTKIVINGSKKKKEDKNKDEYISSTSSNRTGLEIISAKFNKRR